MDNEISGRELMDKVTPDLHQVSVHHCASLVVSVAFYREPDAYDLPLPFYATGQAAGMDLHAALPTGQTLIMHPGQRALITTGLRMLLPPGYEGQIRARSGLAVRYGIGVLNAPGTIDSDFRGVLQILLINWGDNPFEIQRGDRIAQLIVAPIIRVVAVAVETYDATPRGDSGFGSTGSGVMSVPEF